MPKIADQYINVRLEDDGDAYRYKAAAKVSTDGVFSIELKEELTDSADAILKRDSQKYVGVGVSYGAKRYVTCKALKEGLALIHAATQDFMRAEVASELVICYQIDNGISYYKSGDGEIFPNGGFVRNYAKDEGKWCGDLHATQRSGTYSIGLGARVYEKRTLTRVSGVTTDYEVTYGGGSHFDQDTWLQKLNQFPALTIDPGSCPEMPYTEDAARFFYQTILGICQISDRMREFFDDPVLLGKRIEARTSFLLPDKAQG